MLNYCNNISTNLSSYKRLAKNNHAVIITTVSCCLSILGACGIFWTYLMMKEIRKFVRTLMVFLTIADFLTASGTFHQRPNNTLGLWFHFLILTYTSDTDETWLLYCGRHSTLFTASDLLETLYEKVIVLTSPHYNKSYFNM